MEGSLIELAGYRLERAKEMLTASEGNLEIGHLIENQIGDSVYEKGKNNP